MFDLLTFNYALITYPVTLSLLGYLVYSFFVYCPHSTVFISRMSAKLLMILVRLTGNKNTSEEKVDCKMINNGQCLEITYKYGNLPYTIYVPYRRGLTKRGIKVWFIPDNEEETQRNITQQAGVPYLITPADMGGKIVIKDMDNRIVQTFSGTDMVKCYSSKYMKE